MRAHWLLSRALKRSTRMRDYQYALGNTFTRNRADARAFIITKPSGGVGANTQLRVLKYTLGNTFTGNRADARAFIVTEPSGGGLRDCALWNIHSEIHFWKSRWCARIFCHWALWGRFARLHALKYTLGNTFLEIALMRAHLLSLSPLGVCAIARL